MVSDFEAKHLWDAREAAEILATFVAARSFDDYLAEQLLRSAVERKLILIGEALNRLRRINPELARTIPDLGTIIAFRNILVHDYANIDQHRVWRILENDLPKLIEAITSCLGQAEPS